MYFGQNHPMKPHRIIIAHNLILNYGLYQKMQCWKPFRASTEDMMQFHSKDYVHFLRTVKLMSSLNSDVKELMKRFCIGTGALDCPIFEGMFDFTQISVGGSLAAAYKLNQQQADICINWSGGLHHAKKAEASGFCYINDIVLGILELLKYHKRVLYLDIDVHHGDGVEEAFFTTDRVMTVSFHRYGSDFFPGTGGFGDVGAGMGRNYSINVPLRLGIDDDAYESIYVPIMQKVMQVYQPDVIVLQLGADSLVGDRLGDFNLTIKGHGKCVSYMRSYNVPMILLGGGGYTVRNVSRCWTYETSVALDMELSNDLPFNDYFEYFGPEHKLHISPDTKMSNANTPEYLQKVTQHVFETLRSIDTAPSVQFQELNFSSSTETQLPETDPDERLPQSLQDMIVTPENEYYSDDE